MIKILDCTLRDGGYINNWSFGKSNICKIVDSLSKSKVDFIEMGFIKDVAEYDEDNTIKNSIKDFEMYFSEDNVIKKVCMINFGEYDISKLPYRDQTNITGIRVTFKKNQVDGALNFAKKIKEKGYDVFIQPMVCVSYTDVEYIELINKVNEFKPFAFYIVDSFGEMNEEDLKRYFYLSENNLDKEIFLGFHSHNNLQLSYSNCKLFVNFKTNHNLIVDSSVLGMGRGAGNLNTEIFYEYLNNNFLTHYNINPIIDVIDKVIANIHSNHFWGYSIPFYLSAKNHCHPNYASYLDGKKTLTFFDIDKIMSTISTEKKLSYDKPYIEKLYIQYQERNNTTTHLEELKKIFDGKDVILVAPGPSYKIKKDNIASMKNNHLLVSVNFIPEGLDVDYTFVSNVKRFSLIENYNPSKMITTTNVVNSNANFIVSYFSLINDTDKISDNAGMMVINLMTKLCVKSIKLAGFDGYSMSPDADYADEYMKLSYYENNQYLNALLSNQIKKYSKSCKIEFLTNSEYLKI